MNKIDLKIFLEIKNWYDKKEFRLDVYYSHMILSLKKVG